MRGDTKQEILEKGSEIIHLKGFNHTGIQEILETVGVPKGSFYNYFKNKEDFGLQIIDYFVAHFDGLSNSILGDASRPPLERIEKLLDFFMEFFTTHDFALGCPIGNLSQEMGDLSPAFREKLNWAVDQMLHGYIRVLEEAQEVGDISKALNIRNTAEFLVTSWHGALVRMKIVKSTEPLENHKRYIFNYVLNS